MEYNLPCAELANGL